MIGSIIGGIVALVKLKPEGEQIFISSAKDVVLIQQGALDELRHQLEDQHLQLEKLEGRFKAELISARQETSQTKKALRDCQREYTRVVALHRREVRLNEELSGRVDVLEEEIAGLRGQSGGSGGSGS